MIEKIHKLIDSGQLKLANSIISQHNDYDSILTPLVGQVFERGRYRIGDYLIKYIVIDGIDYHASYLTINNVDDTICYDDLRCTDTPLIGRKKWVYQQLYVMLNYQQTVGEMYSTLIKCDIEYFKDISGLDYNIIRRIIDFQVRSNSTEIELFSITNNSTQKTVRLYFKRTQYGYDYHLSVTDLSSHLIFIDIMHTSQWHNNHQIISAFVNQINRHT